MNSANSGLNVSSILSRTFSLIFGHPGTFLPIALIVCLPLEELLPLKGAMLFLNAVLSALVAGAIARATFQALTNNPVSLKDALGRIAPRMAEGAVVTLLVGLCLLAGIILLVIPGIIVYCMLAFSVQICLMENMKPIASLKQSRELTRGHRWPIFGLSVIGMIFVIASLFALVFGLESIAALLSIDPENTSISAFIYMVALLPGAVFFNTLNAVMYFDLRNMKEGLGLQAATAVFD